jgi:hypothetical protein
LAGWLATKTRTRQSTGSPEEHWPDRRSAADGHGKIT